MLVALGRKQMFHIGRRGCHSTAISTKRGRLRIHIEHKRVLVILRPKRDVQIALQLAWRSLSVVGWSTAFLFLAVESTRTLNYCGLQRDFQFVHCANAHCYGSTKFRVLSIRKGYQRLLRFCKTWIAMDSGLIVNSVKRSGLLTVGAIDRLRGVP